MNLAWRFNAWGLLPRRVATIDLRFSFKRRYATIDLCFSFKRRYATRDTSSTGPALKGRAKFMTTLRVEKH